MGVVKARQLTQRGINKRGVNMTTWQMIWAAVWRFGRVLIGQGIALLITQTAGINIPYVNLALGSVISMAAKFLRDKFKWEWLPV